MDSKLHFSTGTDTWATPQSFFDELNREFEFTLDPCCLPESAKCAKYYTPETDGLKQDWAGEIVFCNPPYSRGQQGKWVKKCLEESRRGATCVMLIPARTDTKIFHEIILPNAEVRFVKGRIKFGGSLNNAPFPSMVVVFKPAKQKEVQDEQ